MMLTREETVSQATNGCFCLHHTNLILKHHHFAHDRGIQPVMFPNYLN